MRLLAFLQKKMKMKSNRYEEIENAIIPGTSVLNKLTENDFFECFYVWKKRINSWIEVKGKYFEGD